MELLTESILTVLGNIKKQEPSHTLVFVTHKKCIIFNLDMRLEYFTLPPVLHLTTWVNDMKSEGHSSRDENMFYVR
jgi:hypothetical protein